MNEWPTTDPPLHTAPPSTECEGNPGWLMMAEDPENKFCYLPKLERRTWFEAQEYCQEKGGNLASINSLQENDVSRFT